MNYTVKIIIVVMMNTFCVSLKAILYQGPMSSPFTEIVTNRMRTLQTNPSVFVQSLSFCNGSDYPNSTYSWNNSIEPIYVNKLVQQHLFDISSVLSFKNSSYNQEMPLQMITLESAQITSLVNNNINNVIKSLHPSIQPKKSQHESIIQEVIPNKSIKLNPYMGDNQVMPVIEFKRMKGQNDQHYLLIIQAKFPTSYGNPSTDYSSFDSSILFDESVLLSSKNLEALTGLSKIFYYTVHIKYDVSNFTLSLDAIDFVGWTQEKPVLTGYLNVLGRQIGINTGQYIPDMIGLSDLKTKAIISKKTTVQLLNDYKRINYGSTRDLIKNLSGLYNQ